MTSHEILVYIGYLILAINTFLFLKSYRRISIAFQIFTIYLLLTLLIQLLSTYIKNSPIKDNLFLSHYYFIGQFVLLSLFFKKIITKDLLKKFISRILISGIIALSIYYTMYPSNYDKLNVFEIIITSIPLIVYCFFFFIQKIEDSDKKFTYIISGFFLYILCSTLLFVAGNIDNDTRNIIWRSNSILYIVYQVLIFVEWYKHYRKKPDKTILQVPKT